MADQLTRVERAQMQITRDALDMGVSAAKAEAGGGVPAGMGSYAMGFFNAVRLISAVPEVLSLLVEAWDGGVDNLSPNPVRRAKVETNMAIWFETWREVIGG